MKQPKTLPEALAILKARGFLPSRMWCEVRGALKQIGQEYAVKKVSKPQGV
jgi:hypothetical protein